MSGMQLTTLACSLEERFREGVHVSVKGRRVHTFPQDKVVSIFDDAAQRVHNIMQDTCLLINALLRQVLGSGTDDQKQTLLNDMFPGKSSGMRLFVKHAMHKLTAMHGKRHSQHGNQTALDSDEALKRVAEQMKDVFAYKERSDLKAILSYEGDKIMTNCCNNVCTHFIARIRKYVKARHGLSRDDFKALSPEDRKTHKDRMARLVLAIIQSPDVEVQGEDASQERDALGLGGEPAWRAFGWVPGRSLQALAMKARERPGTPEGSAFVRMAMRATHHMSTYMESQDMSGMAIFPLKRACTPGFISIDNSAFDSLMSTAYLHHKHGKSAESWNGKQSPDQFQLGESLSLKGLAQPWRIHTTLFLTDGVSARVLRSAGSREQVESDKEVKKLGSARSGKRTKEAVAAIRSTRAGPSIQDPGPSPSSPVSPPSPCIRPKLYMQADDLRVALHGAGMTPGDILMVGVDPGKHEPIVAASCESFKPSAITSSGVLPRAKQRDYATTRITRRQIVKEVGSKRMAKTLRSMRPREVVDAERMLEEAKEKAGPGSEQLGEVGENGESAERRTPNGKSMQFDAFAAYARTYASGRCARNQFYADTTWWRARYPNTKSPRERRWAAFKNHQRCMQHLIDRLNALQCDDRQVVLGYGSWGMVAGQPGNVTNKGIPPTMGVGLMRLLAKHFPVLLVPEAYTSKTCFFCNELRSAVAHDRMKRRFKDKNGNNVEREVRGLRVCNNQGCSARCLNRDLNAALNIGKRAWHLVRGEVPPNMDAVAAKVRDDPHMQVCAACTDGGSGD